VRKIMLIGMLLLATGCATLSLPKASTGPQRDYQQAAALEKDAKYQEAIQAYRKIINNAPQAPEAADALYEIAYLQAFYANPQKDYALALQSFDQFLELHPDHAKAPSAENWRIVLKIILDDKKEILDIRKENEQLKKSIDELKKLDIRHEERRRK